MLQPSLAFLQGLATNEVAGILAGAKAILFTGNPSLNRGTVLADLVQPTFTGYAPIAITFGAQYEGPTGSILVDSQLLSWQPSDAVGLPQVITGIAVYATIATVDTLLLSEDLAASALLGSPLDAVKQVLHFDVVNQKIWGDNVQVAP